jgi:hypothetical protein
MKKQDIVERFVESVLPLVHEKYESNGRTDYPARREAWNDYVDFLCKSGEVTEHQAATWVQPAFCNPPKPRKLVTHEAEILKARELYGDPGEIEVDTDAGISKSEGGVWVAAWVWVPDGD